MQQAATLNVSTQNMRNQQQTNMKLQTSNDITKNFTDSQQAWMQQWFVLLK